MMKLEITPRLLLAVTGLVLIPVSVSAVPTLITFTAGSPIRAADINSNFTTLRTAIQGLESGTRCKVIVEGCAADTCDATCPTNFHVEAGGCDAVAGVPLVESMPAGPSSFTNGEQPIDFFWKWHCRTDGSGNIQGAYAYCCQD